ncbi:hypothetical protein [uncultured Ruegeria sp.]|uniref:hypothetical protein n=1 Tax=uncultured Ruegeria sp. TaxID=259304 RepID=UPI0026383BC5|nr:hypothetical protein [uncultured Ruegeria sp.]
MIDRAKRDKIADIVDALTHVGMTVERKLDSIGLITGHADGQSIPELECVDGVASLRDEGVMYAIGNPEE